MSRRSVASIASAARSLQVEVRTIRCPILPGVIDILTIPARRPVKTVYIRKLVRFIDAVTGVKS
jgi:hypothetical protein